MHTQTTSSLRFVVHVGSKKILGELPRKGKTNLHRLTKVSKVFNLLSCRWKEKHTIKRECRVASVWEETLASNAQENSILLYICWQRRKRFVLYTLLDFTGPDISIKLSKNWTQPQKSPSVNRYICPTAAAQLMLASFYFCIFMQSVLGILSIPSLDHFEKGRQADNPNHTFLHFTCWLSAPQSDINDITTA